MLVAATTDDDVLPPLRAAFTSVLAVVATLLSMTLTQRVFLLRRWYIFNLYLLSFYLSVSLSVSLSFYLFLFLCLSHSIQSSLCLSVSVCVSLSRLMCARCVARSLARCVVLCCVVSPLPLTLYLDKIYLTFSIPQSSSLTYLSSFVFTLLMFYFIQPPPLDFKLNSLILIVPVSF